MKILWKIVNKNCGFLNNLSGQLYMNIRVKALKKLGVKINGRPSYIDPSAYFDGEGYYMITLNDGCVISRNVTLLVHDYSITRALKAIGKSKGLVKILDTIEIGENSFVGASVILLPGTHIGKNVIVGAGTVIKGKVEDSIVVAGNPARRLKSIEEYAMKWMKNNDDK